MSSAAQRAASSANTPERFPHPGTRLFWSVLGVTTLLSVIVAFFVHGGLHGLYADDYVYKSMGADLVRTGWNLNFNYRLLGNFFAELFAYGLPGSELAVRLALVALHLLNVGLLGLLAYRLTHSSFVAILSSAFFLIPVSADEALLWYTGAIFYLAPLCLLLVGFHLALTRAAGRAQWLFALGAFLAWVVMLQFIESGFFVILLVPVLNRVRPAPARVERRVWLPLLVLTYALLGGYILLVLRTSAVVALHGTTSLDPFFVISQRVPQLLDSLLDRYSAWEPSGAFASAFQLGLREWWSAPSSRICLGLLALGLGSTATLFPRRTGDRPDPSNSGKLALVGLAWLALALAPVLFIVNLTISPRVLLFPMAGLALALAGLCGWVVDRLGRWSEIGARAALLVAGAVILVNALTLAGLVQVYRLRAELDAKQVAMLRAAVPTLPDSQVWFLPLELNERSVSAYLGSSSVLDGYLYGLFEIPWAAEPALRMAYGQEQIGVIAKDAHRQVHLTQLSYWTKLGPSQLIFGEGPSQQQATLEQLFAFTFRQGHLVLLNPLTVSSSTTGNRMTLDLPLGARLTHSAAASQPFELPLENP